ncbi:uncharacterized protein LOC117179074 [Belonocnema kinseyi]|uniref:uncharacterized protein LOC117179074 n=1 Tax=Belonocnema kinseyi TaxID=2817044 RepID=UPI00143D003D|nr:uncharacterized protein LOC117179074 [Belonocnema kinseyi]
MFGLGSDSEYAVGICPMENIARNEHFKCCQIFSVTNQCGWGSLIRGNATFSRRFIKNFSLIAKPLTDLTGKNAKFVWGPEQQEAFDILKQRLFEKPVLAIYRLGAETEVHTDAIQIGMGTVLLPRQEDHKLHPVCCFNRKTSEDESKCHSYELEALAIVCALERFRVYLFGIIFIIRTDCNSLKLLESKRDLGVSNVVADGPSRNPAKPAEELGLVGLPAVGLRITTDWVAAMQRASAEIMQIRDRLEEGVQETHERFTTCNAQVYRKKKGRFLLYVLVDLRNELVAEAHRGLAHLGVDKTLGKAPSGRKPGYLHPLEQGIIPFQSVDVDHPGLYVVSERGNKYACEIVCGHSKYTVLKAVKDQSAVKVVEMLKEFIAHYGKPDRIISDRGTAFTAAEFEKCCEKYEIQHMKIASKIANGQVERTNRVLTTCLASVTEDDENREWDDKLWDVQWAINNGEHKVTMRTPYKVVFKNRTPRLLEKPLTREIITLIREKAVEEPKDVVELLAANAVTMKERFDKKRKAPREYEVGDLLMILSDSPSTGESRKLAPKKRRPYQIIKVLRNDRYAMENIEGEKQSNKRYQGVISVVRLDSVPKQAS